jgi:hypothetical protein
MHDILKLIHVLAFSVGFGGGVAGAIVGIRSAKAEPSLRPILGGIQMILGRIGFICIILLWITGLWMFFRDYHGDAADLGLPFAIKILAVIVATIGSLGAQYVGIRFRRAGSPPPMDLMKRIGQTVVLAVLISIIFAVITFG